MSTFIERLDPGPGPGPRLAVKDLVDMEGLPTTAGSRRVASRAEPATRDAHVIVRARDAGARIVGKTNLHELAFGATGINPWFGTPVNPIDPALIPGGSSSGSAVAVAAGETDVAIGTDSAGSIRTPSACCGIVGLKTTAGRIPSEGVWPLAPSLDTIGPMARTVDELVTAMALLEPGFEPAGEVPAAVARVRLPDVDPAIDSAIDRVLATAELVVTEIGIEGWEEASDAGLAVLMAEAHSVDARLHDQPGPPLGDDVTERLRAGAGLRGAAHRRALVHARSWRTRLRGLLERWPLLVLPTLPVLAPPLEAPGVFNRRHHVAINLAGVPALALPVPMDGPVPASLQVVATHGAEDVLVAAGAHLEAAARA